MHNNPEGKDGLASSSKTTEVDIVGSAEDGMILAEKNQASDNESSQVPHMNEPELAKELQWPVSVHRVRAFGDFLQIPQNRWNRSWICKAWRLLLIFWVSRVHERTESSTFGAGTGLQRLKQVVRSKLALENAAGESKNSNIKLQLENSELAEVGNHSNPCQFCFGTSRGRRSKEIEPQLGTRKLRSGKLNWATPSRSVCWSRRAILSSVA